ncbi:MAG: 16S rRNA (adenine(1518)-N(6)/adenine(1519)-N(6))-dimethyltransferase RsmA [Rhodospirillaceae bacterium]
MPHTPRKRFSQNFLIDGTVVAAIVAAIAPRLDDNMVEIGPGKGALTRPLTERVAQLHVIEIDRDLAAALRERYAPERLLVHEGDALDFDFGKLGPRLRVVGNLPYHISTPILFRLVDCVHVLHDVHVMLQKEVVDRMVAPAGGSEYGRLSVMLQYYFDMENVLDVPPDAFYPQPKVMSSVVRMMPRAEKIAAKDAPMLQRIVTAAFAQRRKTLRNTLNAYLAAQDYAELGLDPRARAQELDVETFVKIADYVAARSAVTPSCAR